MAQELSGVDPDEVSPVHRGANRLRFALLKEAGGTMQLSKGLADAVTVPHPSEGAMIDALRKGGADESTQEAALLIARLSKALEDELPAALRPDLDAVIKSMASKPDANADDEPDDDADDVEKRSMDPNVGGGVDRDKIPADDFVDPEKRRFPIVEPKDVKDAVSSFGRANPKIPLDRFRSRLRSIASRKGKAFVDALPANWGASGGGDDVKKETDMGDGTIKVPVRKDDGSWDLSGVDPDSRPFYETVLKQQDDLRAENKGLLEKVEKAQGDFAAEREKRVEAELVKKAEGELSHVASKADVVEVLKAARSTMTVEQYEKLEGILKSADERIEKGDLFAELGRTGGSVNDGRDTDAWSKIEKAAEEIVAKSGEEPLSQAQAVARVLKERPELYSAYLAEASGGVR